ncbi:MAG: murein biosynthesis integral membrane protein MurJ, partial [Acidobacteria bacterium]|nr:murein biosynthesis integral membrane protein MurJ [Acidobacteriota bacterium]
MSSKLARSAGVIGIATMTSRVLGIARETVLAAMFGAGATMDAFNVAFRVPNLLRDLFAEGAMTAAFVPTFTRALHQRGKAEAWRVGNLVLNALLLVTGALVVIGIFLAGPVTRRLAGAYEGDQEWLTLTATLTRIMLPFLPAIAIAVAMMGMLNSLRRFFIPALSPAMFNVATIGCAIAAVPLMPRLGLHPVIGLAIGTLLGGLGQILLQWPSLRKEGFRYQPILSFRDPDVKEILRLMGPGTLGVAAAPINVLVNTYLATSQGVGPVSWLTYAFRLMYLPIGIFGVSVATAALPEMSRQAGENDLAGMRRSVSTALRLMLVLNVPATVGLMALSQPIVELLLEYRKFTDRDTVATAAALMFYAPGLLGYSAVKIISPAFYAMKDSRTPVTISLLAVATNLGLNLFLVRVLGYRGLALGTAIAAIMNGFMLLWVLRGRIHGFEGTRVLTTFMKITLASLLMGIAAYMTSSWLQTALPGDAPVMRAVRVFTAIGAGIVV